MFRRFRIAALASVTALSLGAFSNVSVAAPKDDAARKLDTSAMENDFLMADFPKAEATLNKALAACGDSGCSPQVKAKVFVHLGIVQFNNGNAQGAEESFAQALKLQPSITVDEDFSTPDIQKAFANAKGKSAGPAPVVAQPQTSTDEDIEHTPLAEQMVNTPIPIWVTASSEAGIGKVVVWYKPFGAESFKKVNMTKKRYGYGVLIDCAEVSTTGPFRYYISIHDEEGDTMTTLGTRAKPFEIKIKNRLDGDAPNLPNEPPPARCAANEDCPPGLPGCPAKARGDKSIGDFCENTVECRKGLVCAGGVCEEGDEVDESSGAYAKNWFSLGVSMDLAVLSGKDVCGRDSQKNNGFACFTTSPIDERYASAGSQYIGYPIRSGRGNAIDGGLGMATVRILLGYDRLLTANIMLGARVGFAFLGGPKPNGGNSFLPLHLEARGSYWFGNEPFARSGFRPFVFVGGGMAQVDSKVEVTVVEDTDAVIADSNLGGVCADQDGDGAIIECTYTEKGRAPQVYPVSQKVEAWRKAGQGFVGGGGGIMYAFTPNAGLTAEVKFSVLFPTTNFVISPTIGFDYGF